MAKTLHYVLYTTVCIVSLIIVFICFWWFTAKPYSKEDFIMPAPYLVMVAVSTNGKFYYADIDVPLNTRFISMGRVRTSNLGQGEVAGSYGQLYVIPNNTAADTVYYAPYESVGEDSGNVDLKEVTKQLKNLSVDDDGSIVGIDGSNGIHYGTSGTATFISLGATAKSVAVSGGRLYTVGTDGNLRYYPSSKSSQNPVLMSPGGITTWKQVSFDGVVCAIQTDGTLWCADANIGAPTANWEKQGTQKFSHICIKGGRLVGVGVDTGIYYSNTYKNPTWTPISRQLYTRTGAVATHLVYDSLNNRENTVNTQLNSFGDSITRVIMFYPALDARRKRYRGSATECNSNEQLIGNMCYLACSSGRAAVGTKCPYKRKHTPAIPVCPPNTTFINGSCYKPCGTNHVAQGQFCLGNSVIKDVKNLENSVAGPTYSCPSDGSVPARYVRIRPTSLIQNNRLCISSVVVKGTVATSDPLRPGSSEQILSRNASPYATDGTCINTPIGGQGCGLFSSYLSGPKYNTDSDGGQLNRISRTYWELDLGRVQNIKTIEFTGCNYVPAEDSSTSTSVDGSSISQPKADQITGMRVELYATSNMATSQPIVTRTLGPELKQILTFNYVTKEPGIDSRCYDACPKINGVQSFDGGDQKCITAVGGISSRSVTSPLSLPDPVCNIPTLPNGNIVSLPGNIINSSGSIVPGSINQWMIDPTNKLKMLSCQELPNSVLMALRGKVKIPYQAGATVSEISYELKNTEGTTIVNPATPFMCVVPSDQLCTIYNTDGMKFSYNGGLCVRTDTYPPVVSGNGTIQWGKQW